MVEINVDTPKILIEKGEIIYEKERLDTRTKKVSTKDISHLGGFQILDVLSYLAQRVNLTKKTIFDIVYEADKFDDIIKNPQQFIDAACAKINHVLKGLMIDGNKYEKIVGKDKKLYFVAETKGRDNIDELRIEEKQKIKCGKEHFEQLDGVQFIGPVSKLSNIQI